MSFSFLLRGFELFFDTEAALADDTAVYTRPFFFFSTAGFSPFFADKSYTLFTEDFMI